MSEGHGRVGRTRAGAPRVPEVLWSVIDSILCNKTGYEPSRSCVGRRGAEERALRSPEYAASRGEIRRGRKA